jgi:hypothetical protein
MNTGSSSKWFPHDADSLEDPKIMILITQLGWEGYGLYWMLIQRLCKQSEYRLPFLLLDSISRVSSTSREKLEAIVTKFALFEVEGDYFYSPSLIRRMQPFEKRMAINKDNAIKGWETRKLKQPVKNAIALQPQSNGDEYNITKHNITKHNTIKEKDKTADSESKDSGSFSSDSIISTLDNDILKLYNWITTGKLPNMKEPVFNERFLPKSEKQRTAWIQCLEKLVRIDKYSLQEVNRAIIYAREDSFWKKNFLSLLKLRDKDKDGVSYISRFIIAYQNPQKGQDKDNGEDPVDKIIREATEAMNKKKLHEGEKI